MIKNENILKLFGDISAYLPEIYYDSKIILPDRTISIDKLFLFRSSQLHPQYEIANNAIQGIRRTRTNITGYFYCGNFLNDIGFFDIEGQFAFIKIHIGSAVIQKMSISSSYFYKFTATSFSFILS